MLNFCFHRGHSFDKFVQSKDCGRRSTPPAMFTIVDLAVRFGHHSVSVIANSAVFVFSLSALLSRLTLTPPNFREPHTLITDMIRDCTCVPRLFPLLCDFVQGPRQLRLLNVQDFRFCTVFSRHFPRYFHVFTTGPLLLTPCNKYRTY